jgi:hypothetical protein
MNLINGVVLIPRGILYLNVLTLFAYMALWSLLGFITLGHSDKAWSIMTESAATVLTWIAVLKIGLMLPNDSSILRRTSIAGIVIVCFCFAHAIELGGFPAGPYLAFSGSEEGGLATYQGIGRSILAIAMVAAFASWPMSKLSLFVLTVAALLLMSVGSRAHLFALAGSLFLHVIMLILNRQTRLFGMVGLLFLIIAVTGSVSFLLESRASEILDLSSSTSWEGRSLAMSRALEIIAEHPLMGSFGYHQLEAVTYAHNALSAWTQYGLIGFLGFCLTMIYSLFISLAGFIASRGAAPEWNLAVHVNLVATILSIGSEPVMSSVFPALAWGLTLRAQSMHRAKSAFFRG